jgi:hypothetical protein
VEIFSKNTAAVSPSIMKYLKDPEKSCVASCLSKTLCVRHTVESSLSVADPECRDGQRKGFCPLSKFNCRAQWVDMAVDTSSMAGQHFL